GMGIQEIAAELQKEHIPKVNGESIWSYNGVLYILTNERYIGDEMFQKRYTTDTLPFTKKDKSWTEKTVLCRRYPRANYQQRGIPKSTRITKAEIRATWTSK
ncbi:Recombinase, partial [human gut metagenome]